MKHTTKGFWFLAVFFALLITTAGCKKNMPPDNQGTGQITSKDGITAADLVTYKGDIGLVLDARDIQKKGYTPTTIQVEVKASSGNFNKTIALNPYTFMGEIRFPVDSLPAAVQTDLKQGVEVTAKVLDASGTALTSETFTKQSFQSNPSPLTVSADALAEKNTSASVPENTVVNMQFIENGAPGSQVVYNITGGGDDYVYLLRLGEGDYNNTGNPFAQAGQYVFQKIPGTTNTYAIKNLKSGLYMRINRHWKLYTYSKQVVMDDLNWNFPTDFINGNTDARFVIKKVSKYGYGLESVQGEKIMIGSVGGFGKFLMINEPGATPFETRFISMNYDWNIESIETQYLQPILPAAKSGFSFNSTLVNCGEGSLKQTIGNSKTVETNTTVGWKESISVMSSYTNSVSVKAGMDVSASFFGNGATYSVEVTGGYECTNQNGKETNNWTETSTKTSETFFSQREVTVPSKSASLVYDAFQSFDNIQVNLVQRLRVRATEHTTGQKMTGEEIATQFFGNRFKGVITEIGADYIEVTIRGVATLDKVFKSKSEVKSVPPNCG